MSLPDEFRGYDGNLYKFRREFDEKDDIVLIYEKFNDFVEENEEFQELINDKYSLAGNQSNMYFFLKENCWADINKASKKTLFVEKAINYYGIKLNDDIFREFIKNLFELEFLNFSDFEKIDQSCILSFIDSYRKTFKKFSHIVVMNETEFCKDKSDVHQNVVNKILEIKNSKKIY